jgi:hypothetical protein
MRACERARRAMRGGYIIMNQHAPGKAGVPLLKVQAMSQ